MPYSHVLTDEDLLNIELAERDLEYADELVKCAADIVYWCNTYVKTYDPRRIERGENPNIPFILYEFQVEYLAYLQRKLDERTHSLSDKSRDMGVSWLNIVFDVHKWLFTPGYKAGYGSYKEDKVDRRGDPDSLFEKMRHLLDNLPGWMLPAGFRVNGEHDNFMRLVNPNNGSTITGEAGKNIGRGGRNTRYTLDEHAFIEQAREVEKAVSQNTNCVNYVSTPNGMGNLFAEKRFSGKVEVFTMHWSRHPKKDEAWYQRQKATLDTVTLAQEVDIDYTASVEGILIPGDWVLAAVEFYEWLQEEDPELAQMLMSGPAVGGLDVGESNDPSAYTCRKGCVITRVEEWRDSNPTQTAWKSRDLGREDAIDKLKYDAIGIGSGTRGTLVTERDDFDQIDPESEKEAEDALQKLDVPFDLVDVPWGSSAVQGDAFRDNKDQPLANRFLNQRIVDWWNLRLRFQATYEHRRGEKRHSPNDMISIPRDHGLIAELSMPLLKYSANGKMKLESKIDMKRRGVKSPNKADALAYAFSTYETAFAIGFY